MTEEKKSIDEKIVPEKTEIDKLKEENEVIKLILAEKQKVNPKSKKYKSQHNYYEKNAQEICKAQKILNNKKLYKLTDDEAIQMTNLNEVLGILSGEKGIKKGDKIYDLIFQAKQYFIHKNDIKQ